VILRQSPYIQEISPDKQVFPLVFSRGLYLERVQFQKLYQKLVPSIQKGHRIVPAQILCSRDERLEQMRDSLLQIIETVPDDERYSPEIEVYFHRLYDDVKRCEASLSAGIAEIANGLVTLNDWESFSESSYWYARILRNALLGQLIPAWKFSHTEEPPLGKGVVQGSIGSNSSAAQFFGVSEVTSFDIFSSDRNRYFKAWIDSDSDPGRWFSKIPGMIEPLIGYWLPGIIDKFIIPQMVATYTYYRSSKEAVPWDELKTWMIGLS